MSLRITREQAADSHAETANGYVVYRGGQSGNVDVLERALPGGFDELLTFATAPRAPEVRYVIALEHGVAGLRFVGNTLEFLDAGGTPRLRASPPEIMDADCIPHEVRFALEGCSADHDGRGPWGRPVHTAGRPVYTASNLGFQYPLPGGARSAVHDDFDVAADRGLRASRVDIAGRTRSRDRRNRLSRTDCRGRHAVQSRNG